MKLQHIILGDVAIAALAIALWSPIVGLSPFDPNILRAAAAITSYVAIPAAAVMVNRPFMGDATMTECSDDILERVCEVTMHGIYRRIRLLGARMGCQNLSDVLLTMIDAQTVMQLNGELQDELPQAGDRADNGKTYAYGKKTKSKHRRTVDSLANSQQRIHFTDEDREQAEAEARRGNHDDKPADWEPFGW